MNTRTIMLSFTRCKNCLLNYRRLPKNSPRKKRAILELFQIFAITAKWRVRTFEKHEMNQITCVETDKIKSKKVDFALSLSTVIANITLLKNRTKKFQAEKQGLP